MFTSWKLYWNYFHTKSKDRKMFVSRDSIFESLLNSAYEKEDYFIRWKNWYIIMDIIIYLVHVYQRWRACWEINWLNVSNNSHNYSYYHYFLSLSHACNNYYNKYTIICITEYAIDRDTTELILLFHWCGLQTLDTAKFPTYRLSTVPIMMAQR